MRSARTKGCLKRFRQILATSGTSSKCIQSSTRVIAALCAEGESVLRNSWHVERGYEDMAGKLASVGARIESVTLDEEPATNDPMYE